MKKIAEKTLKLSLLSVLLAGCNLSVSSGEHFLNPCKEVNISIKGVHKTITKHEDIMPRQLFSARFYQLM